MGQAAGRKKPRSALRRAPAPIWSPSSYDRALMKAVIVVAADSFGLVYSDDEVSALVDHATATPSRARAAMANYWLVVELERCLLL
jgi:hypothetical protein